MEIIVFDKSKWHFNGDFPEDLEAYQGYVHTGFYIGWLIVNNMISDAFKQECGESIMQFENMDLSCVKLYMEQLDGVFTSEELNEEGLVFTKEYYDSDNAKYMADYNVTFGAKVPTLYHVQDNWENFREICLTINFRYKKWKDNPETLQLSIKI